MKKFRQLIRECGEGTVMYNHLHMNLLKAGLVRTRGMGTAGRSRSRGRGRGRGRGRARQLYAAAAAAVPSVNCPLPDRTDQHNPSRDSHEVNDVIRHSQAPQGPVDLVKRNDFPQETSENYFLNLSQKRRDGHEMNIQFEPIKSQQIGLQDSVNNPLNLATQRGCSFVAPRREINSCNPARKSPVFRPFQNEMPSTVTHQVFQNDPRSRDVVSFSPGPSRSSPRPATNVGIAFVKEIVDCIFPELIYRPLAAEGREYLEVTPREATLLPGPVSSNQGAYGTPILCPCHPARILVSPEGRVEFQAAFKTLNTVHALLTSGGGGDSTAWRKSVLECVHSLTTQAGYRFCPGLGQAVPSVRCDDLMTSDFGLGFRSASCELWYRPQPRDVTAEVVNPSTSTHPLEGANGASSPTTHGLKGGFGDEESVESTALFMSDELGACAQCLDAFRQRNLRDGRRKQRNPRQMKQ
ncbi:uncharacterized protein LOC119731096 [Patiria miniata]|uniref:Uncharacterized protein n=1 Tax=Patiria miniata TaxID=46514 RepID=A0A914A9D7_PATMI|nr:uncharacterized protein LOC119731096 [Patiria miniata]